MNYTKRNAISKALSNLRLSGNCDPATAQTIWIWTKRCQRKQTAGAVVMEMNEVREGIKAMHCDEADALLKALDEALL